MVSLLRWAKAVEVEAAPVVTPKFLRLEVAPTRAAALIVEVGVARIVVERGFDAAHLRAVVAALAEPAT